MESGLLEGKPSNAPSKFALIKSCYNSPYAREILIPIQA